MKPPTLKLLPSTRDASTCFPPRCGPPRDGPHGPLHPGQIFLACSRFSHLLKRNKTWDTSGCGWIIGLFLYGRALKGVNGKVAHRIPVALLVGIFVAAILLQAVGLMDLDGWSRLLLSVSLQGASLFCGWWAAEQLSNPHGGVCEKHLVPHR